MSEQMSPLDAMFLKALIPAEAGPVALVRVASHGPDR